MSDNIESTKTVWVSLDDLMLERLTNLLENVVENHTKNIEAIDRILTLLDYCSEERTRLIKMSNDEYEKLTIYKEILKQLQFTDTSTYTIKPEPGSKLKLSI